MHTASKSWRSQSRAGLTDEQSGEVILRVLRVAVGCVFMVLLNDWV